MATPLTWLEINTDALEHNVRSFRTLVGDSCLLAPVVKANGYGHGLLLSAEAFVRGGADWICVHELEEAERLREGGIDLPLYVVGYIPPADADAVVAADVRVVVYSSDVVRALSTAGEKAGVEVPVHLKLETGNNRQGLRLDRAWSLLEEIRRLPGVRLEGLATHFADVEDTTDHTYAQRQLEGFQAFLERCESEGVTIPIVHSANSAATLLWPHAHRNLVRVGISAYGMWPSKETLITALQAERARVELRGALKWKAVVAQVKDVAAGEYVGYGRTYRTTHPTRLAVVTVGYYDGYDRKLSNQAFVLIDGHRAPVRGRVCMNMIMVDVTHVPGVGEGTEVVLLGKSGDDSISPELMAEWVGTIQYEIPTRIHERIPRLPCRDA